MKKFQLLGLALFAVFAFSVVAAASAFAGEWLLDGAAIAAPVAAETEGFLLLSDLKAILGAAAEVLCSGIIVGTVGAGSADTTTEVLNLAKEAISLTPLTGLALECEPEKGCTAPVLVWAENLSYTSAIVLMAGAGELEFLDLFSTSGNGQPAWEVECESLIGKVSDLCEGETSGWLVNMAEGSEKDVLGFFSEADEEAEGLLATCTLSGAKTGGVETENEDGTFGGGLIFVTGHTLAVS
jgi:hypothetical protein